MNDIQTLDEACVAIDAVVVWLRLQPQGLHTDAVWQWGHDILDAGCSPDFPGACLLCGD